MVLVSAADDLSYPIHQRRLSNGLRVVVSPDHSVPMVAVNLWYDVGSRDERPGEFGWAHLFEHLMFSGSAQVGNGEHLNSLQALGGSVNATTWFDRTNYFETLPVGALDLALWMEADRLGTLAEHLDQDKVDTQREVVKEEKRQRYDNVPYGEAMTNLVELIFGAEHPYGHTTIGSMDDLDRATSEQAAAFFARHYRADNAVLTLVGDLTPREGFRKADRFFGGLASWNPKQRPPAKPLEPIAGLPRRTLRVDVPAPASYLGWRLPVRDTPGADAAELGLAVLGSGQTARLHRRIVRDEQLAAGVSASMMPLIGGNSMAVVSLRCLPGTDPQPALAAACEELERMAEHGPTPAELDRVKAQYQRQWLTELARFDSRADLISSYALLHGDPERINWRLAEIESLTCTDVTTACAQFLRPEQRAQLDYRPEDADA
jgi:Predicted Zn-dependent peptidases